MASQKSAAAPRHRKAQNPITDPQVEITTEAIAQLAYALWESRGRHGGSPEEDWFRAEEQLQSAGR